MGRRTVMILLVGAVALFFYLVDPSVTAIGPPCPWRTIAGVRCPGCGTLRALHRLMQGDLAGALQLNAPATLILPAMGLGLLALPGRRVASRRERGR